MNTFKPGTIISFRGDPNDLYLVCEHNDGGCIITRLIFLGKRVGFTIGTPENSIEWLREQFEEVGHFDDVFVKRTDLVNDLYEGDKT